MCDVGASTPPTIILTLAVGRAFAGVEGAKVHTAERPMAAIAAKSAVRLNMVASYGSVRAIDWSDGRCTGSRNFRKPLSSSLQPWRSRFHIWLPHNPEHGEEACPHVRLGDIPDQRHTGCRSRPRRNQRRQGFERDQGSDHEIRDHRSNTAGTAGCAAREMTTPQSRQNSKRRLEGIDPMDRSVGRCAYVLGQP
jgi:hypothetical protein